MEKQKKRDCEERQNRGEVIFSLSLSAHTRSSLLWRQLRVPPGFCCSSGEELCFAHRLPALPRLCPATGGHVARGEDGPRATGAGHGPWLCFGTWEGMLGGWRFGSCQPFPDLCLGLWCARRGQHPSDKCLTAHAGGPGSLSSVRVCFPNRC